MQKPEVRIVEYQQEENKDISVPESEKDFLLAKYGYKSFPNNQQEQTNLPPSLSFEQMIEIEERKLKEKKQRDLEERSRPKPYSFDQINYQESKYSSLDMDGFNYGIQVQIISDMPINYRR